MGAVNHTQQSRARVIEGFVQTGRVDKACELAGVSRGCHYLWLKDDPEYAKAFAEARRSAVQSLIDEATRRAVEGVERPVGVAGEAVMVREYSDRLLEFLIKGQAPETYGDRFRAELSGPDGGPVAHKITIEVVDSPRSLAAPVAQLAIEGQVTPEED